MHRIDSATARANVNGQGKDGFHDNGDLPNQDATYFTPAWANAVQEELSNVIEEWGVSLDKANNAQLLSVLVAQFAEKTVLESTINIMTDTFNQQSARIEALENRTFEDTQIGELFWTTEHFVTPSQVSQYKGYGTWERALQGRVAVGFSDIADDPVEFRENAIEYGESTVTLQEKNIPEHAHEQRLAQENTPVPYVWNTGVGEIGKQAHYDKADSKGSAVTTGSWGGENGQAQPFSIQPPSKTLNCWKRIA